jgi:hypothetical protein
MWLYFFGNLKQKFTKINHTICDSEIKMWMLSYKPKKSFIYCIEYPMALRIMFGYCMTPPPTAAIQLWQAVQSFMTEFKKFMYLHSVYLLGCMYTVFRAQADWTLILPSAASCESAASLAEKNATTQSIQLAHIVSFFC